MNICLLLLLLRCGWLLRLLLRWRLLRLLLRRLLLLLWLLWLLWLLDRRSRGLRLLRLCLLLLRMRCHHITFYITICVMLL